MVEGGVEGGESDACCNVGIGGYVALWKVVELSVEVNLAYLPDYAVALQGECVGYLACFVIADMLLVDIGVDCAQGVIEDVAECSVGSQEDGFIGRG